MPLPIKDDRVAVCVFAKPPTPGVAKTRLARTAGETLAAQLAYAFILDTWKAVCDLPWARPILSTTSAWPTEFDFGAEEIWLQGEGDLGMRIERTMTRALSVAPRAIALGADTPGLPLAILESGEQALRDGDAALGPSDDGGFYLLGLTRCPSGLFDSLPWSSPATFAQTELRLRQRGLTTSILRPWFDVDCGEDLDRLTQLLREGNIRAPETARVLGIVPTTERVEPACE